MVSRLDVIIILNTLKALLHNSLIKIYFIPYFRYYNMPVDQVQKLINAIDNNKTEFTYSPIISEKLRELIKIPKPEKKLADELKEQKESMNNKFEQLNHELEQTKDEVKQTKDELNQQIKDELQQQMKNIQELLNSFIENSNSNKSNK